MGGVVKHLRCEILVSCAGDQKDRRAWSNYPMLDVVKLLEFCLGSCCWLCTLPCCPWGSASTSKVLGHCDLVPTCSC